MPASQGVLQGFFLSASLLLVAVLPIYDKVSRREHPLAVYRLAGSRRIVCLLVSGNREIDAS